MPQCSVPACNKQGGHKFPTKDPVRLKRWIIAIKREEAGKPGQLWKPCSTARVCHDHFDENDYRQTNYYGDRPGKRELLETAVPHIFECWKERLPHNQSMKRRTSTERSERAQKRACVQLDTDKNHSCDDVGMEVEIPPNVDLCETEVVDPRHSSVMVNSEVQTKSNWKLYSASSMGCDMLHFYTGLESYDKFKMVLDSLGPAAYELNYYYGASPPVTIEDQFLVTLIKLRRHTPHQEIGFWFGINEKQVTNIFVTWINFMSLQWKEINWWRCKEFVQFFCPSDFKAKFLDGFLDGAECPIQKPSNALAQQATFSSYKNRNTVKTVVGGSPGGLVTYLSDAYGGSTSDRQITERSGLTHMCDAGDEIMVDKGFNVDDIFIPFQVSLNIPSFFRKKNRMSCPRVAKDRKIASKRVHIERLIGLGKTYRILTNPMNHIEASMSTQIIHVIFTLCNFRSCIIPRHALFVPFFSHLRLFHSCNSRHHYKSGTGKFWPFLDCHQTFRLSRWMVLNVFKIISLLSDGGARTVDRKPPTPDTDSPLNPCSFLAAFPLTRATKSRQDIKDQTLF